MKKNTIRKYVIFLMSFTFFWFYPDKVKSEVPSSSKYILMKGDVVTGGGKISSDSYSVYASFGQSSPTGDNSGSSYSTNTGFLDDSDLDGDGVLLDEDACPTENSTGFDANIDGCIDTLNGLSEIITKLPDDVLSDNTKNSLVAKVNAAIGSEDRDKTETAINQLNAFINEVSAQKGKKISLTVAEMLIQYARNVITIIGSE